MTQRICQPYHRGRKAVFTAAREAEAATNAASKDVQKGLAEIRKGEGAVNHAKNTAFSSATTSSRSLNLSFRERADECADNVPSMRDKRYLYIKNYMPWFPNGQHLNYMWQMTATQARHQHYLDGHCDAVTGRFFHERPSEEFYDTVEDFHNIDNRIDAPRQQAKIEELRRTLRATDKDLAASVLKSRTAKHPKHSRVIQTIKRLQFVPSLSARNPTKKAIQNHLLPPSFC